MPIYEFYCSDCHTVFSFLSRSVNTTRRPPCPRCGRPRLERKASSFAISRGRPETDGEPDLPDVDEARMERAMATLAREAEGMSEDDPRHMARLMRKLYDSAGLPLGGTMDEAIRRMEAGEDPEKIEEEIGDLVEDDDPLLGGAGTAGVRGGLRRLRRRLRPPDKDETLYEL
jgi:putative FmdB family regulatory protein